MADLPVTLTTTLDAVNVILRAAGETPVDSFPGPTIDSAQAYNVLGEVSREVQSEGWNFNLEEDVVLTPDVSGHIAVAANVLGMEFSRDEFPYVKPVQRGAVLYDAKNHTDVFTEPLKANIIYLLDFPSLPETARRYIAVRAARVFVQSYIGAPEQSRFSEMDEQRARLALLEAQSDEENFSIFDSSQMQTRLMRSPSRWSR